MDFSYVHIRYFKGYLYHICLHDTIQCSEIVTSPLPSNVAAHATATCALDNWVRYQGTLNSRFVVLPLELRFGTLNPCFVAWPLELRLATRNPCFGVARQVEV